MSPRRPDMGRRFAALEERVRRLERQVEDQVTLDRRTIAAFSAPGSFSTDTNQRPVFIGTTASLVGAKVATGTGTFTLNRNGAAAFVTVSLTDTSLKWTPINVTLNPGDYLELTITATGGTNLNVWVLE